MPPSPRWRFTIVCAGLLTASAVACAFGSASGPRKLAKPVRSPGCDGAPEAGASFRRAALQVAGRERSYHLRLPDGYQAARAYPLVFRFHGHSGDGMSGGLDIERPAGKEAIVVGPDGLGSNWTPQSEQNDLALFDALFDTVSQRYCVDLARVYSYGFSAGGGMTSLLACARADKLRAIAVIAGVEREHSGCGKPVSAWFSHDRHDPTVPLSEGVRARERLRRQNRCGASTTPAAPGCVRYQGCAAPLVWCETQGRGHDIDGERAPERVWAFFESL
jgi:poly(3-hydroxybutyrate) depolymerase